MTQTDTPNRILILFPPRDAEIALELLTATQVPAVVCRDMTDLCREIENGVSVVLVTEEYIDFGKGEELKKTVDSQPPWSDLPIIVFTRRSVGSEVAVLAMERLGNVTLLERPIRMNTLVSVLRTALKARRRQFQIRDYVAELEQFAYVSSHDLKEPLRKITMYAELLEKKASELSSPEMRGWLNNITTGVMRMHNLIEDLLAYSRVDRTEFAREAVDLNDTLKSVLSDLEPTINDARAIITSDMLPVVHGSRVQLRQLFQNLIANAIKFHGDVDPEVHIALAQTSEMTRISVRDNGIGIEPRFSDKIFQVFSRLHSVQRYPGTGIGLAICKKIVERHGGRIWVESEPGKGSAFHFTLSNALNSFAADLDGRLIRQ